MRPAIPLLAGLLSVAVLSYFCAVDVQQRVLEDATAKLAADGFDWATPEADGRWIVVTGLAPSEEADEAARASVLSLPAVTRVFDGTGSAPAVIEPVPADSTETTP